MGGGYVSNAGVFLVDFIFGLYIFFVLLRLLLQLVRADFYNPLCQTIVTVTNPPLRPMRRYIPSLGGVDSSCIVLLLVLQATNTALIALIVGASPAVGGLIVVAIAELLNKVVWTFLGAVLIGVVISWVAQGTYNPIIGVIDSLTRPLLEPARRIMPPFGALDLSPILVILALQLARMLLVTPLRDLGLSML